MNITNAYYLVPRDDEGNIISGADAIGIKATVDGTPCHVPLDNANTTYAEIQKQIAEGTLTVGSASDYDKVIAAELAADGH
tara:strand:+ start:2459 stop:2701 length:243 start_codon:yes stop_codon:yes gene_type:complete